jgi:hypothetical protein
MTLIHTSNKRILSFDHPHKFNDRGLKMPGKRMGSKEMQHRRYYGSFSVEI